MSADPKQAPAPEETLPPDAGDAALQRSSDPDATLLRASSEDETAIAQRPLGPALFDSLSDATAASGALADSAGGPVQPGSSTAALSHEEAGRYSLVREFGRGGQAVVWLAHDAHVGRQIAFKQMLPGREAHRSATSLSGAAVRFLREARITGQLEHPGIAPVHEVGERPDGSLYYTQKLVRGRTLRAALDACATLRDRLGLLSHFVDVCQAVAYAHGRGVLHRDLKPANIMVGEFGETVVLDWGLAKVRGAGAEPSSSQSSGELSRDSAETQDGAVLGTPLYMSPEQALGKLDEVDERSDVWGLGAILYEILAGRPPFVGSSPGEVLAQLVRRDVPPLRALAPDAPAELIAVAERALQRDRARRYASARELAQEGEAFQSGARVLAYEYSSWELAGRFVRRNKLLSAVTAVAAVALLVSTVMVHRAHLETLRSLADVMAVRARDADAASRWSHAAAYWAAARSESDGEEARWGELEASRLAPRPVRTLAGDGGQVWAVAVSPDGAKIASASDDGALRLWDARTGALLSGLPATGPIVALAWRGGFIATASGDRVQLRGPDGAVVRELDAGAETRAVALSPDGALLAYGNQEGLLRLIETATGRERFKLAVAPHDRVAALAFSADGRRIAAGSYDGNTVLRDLAGKELARIALPEVHVWAVGLSPDGSKVAIGASSGTLRLWEPASAAAPTRLDGHSRVMSSAVFSPDGRMLATASRDGTVRLWDAGTLRPLAAFDGGDRAVNGLAFTPDGATLVAANEDATVRLWALQQPQPQGALLGHTGKVREIAFSPDGSALASAADDGSVRLWDPAAGRETSRIPVAGKAHSLAYARDGSLAWSADSAVLVRSPGGATRELRGLPGLVGAIAFAPGGLMLAAADREGALRVWDLATGEGRSVATKHERVNCAAFSPDGALVATGGDDNQLRLWDSRTLAPRGELRGHPGRVRALAFSPDGKLLASGSNNRIALVFSVADGKVAARLDGHEGPVRAVAFSPDGTVIATGSDDHTVRLWNASSGAPLRRFARHADGVETVAWSSRWLLASSGHDKTIELLQLGDPAKLPPASRALGEVLDAQWLELARLQLRSKPR